MLWVHSGPGDLTFITWSADSNVAGAGESVRHAYSEIGQRLREDDLVVLHERVFGDDRLRGIDCGGPCCSARRGL